MALPVSPHLSELQPSDESVESVAFNYFSLALVVRGEALPKGPPVNSIGFVELFGTSDHAESTVVLRPGEWIRVSANVKLLMPPSEPVSVRFQGDFWLRDNTFHPHAAGQFIEANNLYPNRTPTLSSRFDYFLTTDSSCQGSSSSASSWLTRTSQIAQNHMMSDYLTSQDLAACWTISSELPTTRP
jgi:hypothetical protein